LSDQSVPSFFRPPLAIFTTVTANDGPKTNNRTDGDCLHSNCGNVPRATRRGDVRDEAERLAADTLATGASEASEASEAAESGQAQMLETTHATATASAPSEQNPARLVTQADSVSGPQIHPIIIRGDND
jgi:hypothetical protein